MVYHARCCHTVSTMENNYQLARQVEKTGHLVRRLKVYYSHGSHSLKKYIERNSHGELTPPAMNPDDKRFLVDKFDIDREANIIIKGLPEPHSEHFEKRTVERVKRSLYLWFAIVADVEFAIRTESGTPRSIWVGFKDVATKELVMKNTHKLKKVRPDVSIHSDEPAHVRRFLKEIKEMKKAIEKTYEDFGGPPVRVDELWVVNKDGYKTVENV